VRDISIGWLPSGGGQPWLLCGPEEVAADFGARGEDAHGPRVGGEPDRRPNFEARRGGAAVRLVLLRWRRLRSRDAEEEVVECSARSGECE
jgi:hypothetical protein